ncbi:acetyltransferase [Ramlibacter sp. AW1]|uniref:Acetyltransferase n=1 Tax=Ramlibacter aurantiacus TaxID=2801330 RepID=A0A936ZLR7_9BURK|nr:acetyltransferase [Ramlibacter aurantiacus]MBL0419560.1 acetyltransferase [Ramlibacter aurantiacus]
MRKVLVVGTGGLAREFASQFSEDADPVEIVGFSSSSCDEHGTFGLPGMLYAGDVSPQVVGTNEAVIAIGSPLVKLRLSEMLRASGFVFPPMIHSSSLVSTKANVGAGVVIAPRCVISPQVEVGEFSYINFSCGIGHDAVIGKFVQINPGSQLGGRATIGDGCLIGSGSTILQGVRVGAGSTIASGSVVFTHVAEKATMMGNPAKRMRALEE